jgi:predicted Kef-type K+ transport protein
MDPLWLAIAFALGFLARLVKLPPLVGYLIAGFILKFMGAESGELIKNISDLGIMLLLFTIGLKLKIKHLLKKEIWGGAIVQMILFITVILTLFYILSFTGITYLNQFDFKIALLIAFALSFSSTVFAVKVLEEKGELTSLHGITAIGVLIIQDLIAVGFLVFETGNIPSIWALAIPVIFIAIRPVLLKILDYAGHGELLILFGFFLAFIVGAELFYLTGLKPDLGALAAGMLIANHKKAKEMADNLMGFKDIFLIGFFLSIGLSGLPTAPMLVIALILALTINFKVILYFLVFTRFKLRARTSVFTSLSLANFSEFGLIIASIAVTKGWISNDWLIIIAIALSISFLISSPLNSNALALFALIKEKLRKFETQLRLSYDQTYDIGQAEILIFGMGRFGVTVYDQLNEKYGKKVLGLDYNMEVVERTKQEGRNVIQDDATDSEFWEKIKNSKIKSSQVKMVLLCMEDHKSNLYAIKRLNAINFNGVIASTANYYDELNELKNLGVQLTFDLKTEAGVGFANHICENMDVCAR